MFYSAQDGKRLPETTVENIITDTLNLVENLGTQVDPTKFNQSIGEKNFS